MKEDIIETLSTMTEELIPAFILHFFGKLNSEEKEKLREEIKSEIIDSEFVYLINKI